MKSFTKTITLVTLLLLCAPTFAQRKPKYISPNNDGVQDTLEIPLRISDKRFILAWSLVVQDTKGNVVRTIENKTTLPEKVTFKSFFKQLVTPKKGVEIPEKVLWNGRMDNGETAPDGTYYYYFTASDDNGNTGRTDTYEVIVDTTPPQITLTQPTDKIFGEGAKTEFTIRQSGSKEDKWSATFSSLEGESVRSYTWEDSEPTTFNWNGTDNKGLPVKDGIYTYSITAKDRAGNVSEPALISNIVFSAEKPVTAITILGSKYFSPNTDSKISTVTFNVTVPEPPVKSGNKLTDWKVSIVDMSGKEHRSYGSANAKLPPEKIVFDGKDSSGKFLSDGQYQAQVSAKYLNGYEPPVAVSPVFMLDTSKPSAKISVSDKVFGAGAKSTLAINQSITPKKLAPVPSWTGTIYSSKDDSKIVKRFFQGEYPQETIFWNGLDFNGKVAPNGEYVFVLTGTDMAGNTGEIRSEPFSLDTTQATIMLATDSTAFSPNGDKVKDTITFTPVTQSGSGGIVKYVFKVTEVGSSIPLRTIQENRSVPQSIVWDGKNDSGTICKDGNYTATLEITSANASTALATTSAFALDTIAPSVTAETSWTSFSPNGNGEQKNLPVNVKDCSSEKVWNAEVKNSQGKVVKKYSWNGTIQSNGKNNFEWNGTDESGNIAPDGTYSITISSTDDAGNAFSKTLPNITLDTREVKAYITTEHDGISPNGDGVLEQQKFTLRPSVSDNIASWTFDVFDQNGNAVRTWSSSEQSAIPATIQWNGKDANGNVCEGIFTGKLNIAYKTGNKISASSSPFVCSATPPVLNVRTTPEYFSPDNDGTDDDLFIRLQGSTKGRISSWSFVIDDPTGRAFWKTNGTASITETIVWDGMSNIQKDANGMAERVQSAMDYPYTFTVKDNLGMSSTVKGIIPIDVLVIREGNVLKMAVPSIIFRSDNADFRVESSPGKKDGVTAAQAKNNERVLTRIAEILNKFKDYKVRIVGHANKTTDNQAEETEDNPQAWGPALIPLSERRAVFVRDYLSKRGVNTSRLSTVGKGGTELVVDWKDKSNNWKNRRVEFILEK